MEVGATGCPVEQTGAPDLNSDVQMTSGTVSCATSAEQAAAGALLFFRHLDWSSGFTAAPVRQTVDFRTLLTITSGLLADDKSPLHTAFRLSAVFTGPALVPPAHSRAAAPPVAHNDKHPAGAPGGRGGHTRYPPASPPCRYYPSAWIRCRQTSLSRRRCWSS